MKGEKRHRKFFCTQKCLVRNAQLHVFQSPDGKKMDTKEWLDYVNTDVETKNPTRKQRKKARTRTETDASVSSSAYRAGPRK